MLIITITAFFGNSNHDNLFFFRMVKVDIRSALQAKFRACQILNRAVYLYRSHYKCLDFLFQIAINNFKTSHSVVPKLHVLFSKFLRVYKITFYSISVQDTYVTVSVLVTIIPIVASDHVIITLLAILKR